MFDSNPANRKKQKTSVEVSDASTAKADEAAVDPAAAPSTTGAPHIPTSVGASSEEDM